MKKTKLDAYNRKILTVLHKEADLSNVDLAERVGLSPSACLQRTKALKEAGYFKGFVVELDLDEICENVIAYLEFKLENNTAPIRRRLEKEIADVPEFMDCVRVTGDYDYICFTCSRDIADLNRAVDEFCAIKELGIVKTNIRIILERAKWMLGYPLHKLDWKE
jgi:Lrp/AsnC family leucine-responsive transcriptional regulator